MSCRALSRSRAAYAQASIGANCDKPDISVIVPCYNAAAYVGAALESTLSQKNVNAELIVVDDGSTDDSANVIDRFGKWIRLVRQPNAGGSHARNVGLSLARGRYIKFLDADDVLEPHVLATQLAQSASLDAKEMVFGDHNLLTDVGRLPPKYIESRNPGNRADFRAVFEDLLISDTLYLRQIIMKLGGFNTSINRSQDGELNCRIHLAGYDFIYQPCKSFLYRIHDNPDRTTTKFGNNTYFRNINVIYSIIEETKNGPRRGEIGNVRRTLGRYCWKVGRQLAIDGEWSEADAFFSTAQKIAGYDSIVGGAAYGAIVRMADPVLTERLYQWTRRLAGRV